MGYASAATSAPAELTIAGRYRVDALLGEGGMGAVYAVTDVSSGKPLALKRLSPGASRGTAALFEREYHTLAGLKHPAIVEVHEYASDHEGPFYTMELIDGADLSRAAPMPWREACRHLRDVASVLGLLHARGLVHRDLSPRNLLRNQVGRLKLIDFGALAPFGPTREVVGTPQFLAPEALRSLPLDQRTDLFGLGALAYWLVTGTHAYPARSLSELPGLWEHELAAPSDMLGVLKLKSTEPIPKELDALIMSMLRIEPIARLASTSELIDRLNAIADLEPESQAMAVQGYLDSKAFVGRQRERERALALLRDADRGHVQTVIVEGEAGVGRTRFLQEMVVVSRLNGALPVIADAEVSDRPYAVAESLLRGLLRSLPQPTRTALAPHAALLGNISKELRDLLDVPLSAAMVYAPAELRVRLLAALREVVLTLSRERLLALFVDDLQSIDEESKALLVALAHAEQGSRLLIVTALRREQSRESTSAALTSLRNQATRLRLLPLKASELLELLRSVFGQAPYLERLAERLYRESDGNPAYCLDLAQHLVASGLARYRDGNWSLPAELADDSFPRSRRDVHVALLEVLSDDARKLARSLSVPHGSQLSLDQCFAVSDLPPAHVRLLLAELERVGVLRTGSEGYRFARHDVQTALYGELGSEDRIQSHVRLGEEITAAAGPDDVVEPLRACLHFFRAGDFARGHLMFGPLARTYYAGDISTLRATAPMFEQIYTLLKERGEDKYGTVEVLSLLAIAGYFSDRRYAERYGEMAISTLQDVLRLPLARRLSRFLGEKLSLIVALVIAGVALHHHRRRAPSIKHAIVQSMAVSAALAGTAATCCDNERAARHAEVIRPFAALGADQGATITYQFARFAALARSGHPARTRQQLLEYIALLDSNTPLGSLPRNSRENFAAGALLMLGVLGSWRDDPECLEIADRLEKFSPLHAMSADQLRASYYGGQGYVERAAKYVARMEMHAIQLGSAWQVEAWGPADSFKIAVRTHNPAIMKRVLQELTRLSDELPALALWERHARGTYLLLRNKFEQAIPLLDTKEDPESNVSWPRTRGLLARAYNGLGQHARARAICTNALEHVSHEDLFYVVTNLVVQLELALAELGLGNVQTAKQQLDKLLVEHQPNDSPVTLGSLHEARARVALSEGVLDEARAHLAQMESHYRKTGAVTLLDLVDSLRREIDRGDGARGDDEDAMPTDRPQHVMLRVQLMLSQNDDTLAADRAEKSLQVALELSSADEGFLVLAIRESPSRTSATTYPRPSWCSGRSKTCSTPPSTSRP